MSQKKEFTLGYAPTRRNVFSKEDALKYKRMIFEKIKGFNINIADMDDINDEGLLLTDEDTLKAAKKFKDKKVDAVFAPHCNFGTENAVANLGKELAKPLLLWGPRDEMPLEDGSRLRDTQCGLFATSKILQRLGVKYTYIVNSRIGDEVFNRGFENFIRAANVVKKFSKVRIGQIGVRPAGFWTVICNEGELLERFGIEVVPFNLIDVINMIQQLVLNPTDELKETERFIKENMEVKINSVALTNLAALAVVIEKLSVNLRLDAFALQCWDSLHENIGIVPCLAHSILFDKKIPVACETDINGAITSVIASAAAFGEKPLFFADITIRHPQDDNAELLWHCGPFPYSLKKEGEKGCVEDHFILDSHPPGTCNWEIKGGDVSIVRFDGVNGKYSIFVGHAKGTDGPKTKGTYLWVKVNDWEKWEECLINGPYIHHVVGVHDKIAPVIFEASKYMNDIKLDLVEPDEKEIRQWLSAR